MNRNVLKIVLIILILVSACSDEKKNVNNGNETDSAMIMLNKKKAEAELLEREIEELRKKNDSLSREYRKYEILDTLAIIQSSSRLGEIILAPNSIERFQKYWLQLGFKMNDVGSSNYFSSFNNNIIIEFLSGQSLIEKFPSIKKITENKQKDIYVSIRNNSLDNLNGYFDQINLKSILETNIKEKNLFFEDEYLNQIIFSPRLTQNRKKELAHRNGASKIISIVFGAKNTEAALDKFISIGFKPERRVKLQHHRKEAYKFDIKNCLLYLVEDEFDEGIIALEILSKDMSLTENYFTNSGVEYLEINSGKYSSILIENELVKLIFVERE